MAVGLLSSLDPATYLDLAPASHTDNGGERAFSPDSKTQASGNRDQTIRLWDINLQAWQARTCRLANRNLTRAEWDQFIGPYERTCPDLPVEPSVAGSP